MQRTFSVYADFLGLAGGENAFGIDLGFYWFICFFNLFVLLTALLHIVGKPQIIFSSLHRHFSAAMWTRHHLQRGRVA